MSKTWKWILGIVIVLVVLALAGGASAVAYRAFRVGSTQAAQSAANGANQGRWRMPMHGTFGGPMAPYQRGEFGQGFGPRMGYGRGFGMMPFGMGFFWLGGLFRLVIPLGLVALSVFLGYLWGKNAASRRVAPASTAPPAAPPPPPVEVVDNQPNPDQPA
jgi:hypothetical protein